MILGEVAGMDKDRKCVFVSATDRESVPGAYDYLILATGVRHGHFGHNEFEQFAPGLKSLADAAGLPDRMRRGLRAQIPDARLNLNKQGRKYMNNSKEEQVATMPSMRSPTNPASHFSQKFLLPRGNAGISRV
jgi:hypothetical protein